MRLLFKEHLSAVKACHVCSGVNLGQILSKVKSKDSI